MPKERIENWYRSNIRVCEMSTTRKRLRSFGSADKGSEILGLAQWRILIDIYW
jgi:hypothetical protein